MSAKYRTVFYLFWWVALPHVIVLLVHPKRASVYEDLLRWKELRKIEYFMHWRKSDSHFRLICCLVYLILIAPEFRNIFYLRIGIVKWLIMWFTRPLSSLYINMPERDFSTGIYIEHGFSTVLYARHIGKNCFINQQVTIGSTKSGIPYIGDNVRIGAGAVIVGNISIGDNCKIGANTTVVKDIPANSTVVSAEARVISSHI